MKAVYTGVAPLARGGPGVVYVERDGVRSHLTHRSKHSPTGFMWGYGDSGPADLARSILFDHFGSDALCDVCLGEGKVERQASPEEVDEGCELGVAYDSCPLCAGEGTTVVLPSMYHAFKFDVVARWPADADWQLSSDDIELWLRSTA